MKTKKSINWNSFDPCPGTQEQQGGSSIDPKIDHTPFEHSDNPVERILAYNQSASLVLVADDDPMIRLLAQQALERRSFEVIQAENGENALELFSTMTPDLVLCDVMMPVVDGFELCSSLRAMKQGEHVPIVMLTGLNDKESIQTWL